jgi:hypothetical protein
MSSMSEKMRQYWSVMLTLAKTTGTCPFVCLRTSANDVLHDQDFYEKGHPGESRMPIAFNPALDTTSTTEVFRSLLVFLPASSVLQVSSARVAGVVVVPQSVFPPEEASARAVNVHLAAQFADAERVHSVWARADSSARADSFPADLVVPLAHDSAPAC